MMPESRVLPVTGDRSRCGMEKSSESEVEALGKSLEVSKLCADTRSFGSTSNSDFPGCCSHTPGPAPLLDLNLRYSLSCSALYFLQAVMLYCL